MKVEVTDLFDAFHELAVLLWRRFEFQGRGYGNPGQIGPRFDEIIDGLESELFLPACARRVWVHSERKLTIDELVRLMTVCDSSGTPYSGPAGQYHGHGFDWGSPRDTDVKNLIVAGDLVGTDRSGSRLIVDLE